jgi:hypothetical protein
MQTTRNELAMRCATSRSKISNGTRLLSNVDGRSREARRFRDLVASFATEIGTDLGEVEMGLVRQAAGLALRAEQLQEAIVRGEPVDNDDLIRISGTSRRILMVLQEKAAKRKQAPATLRDRLQQRAAERTEA